MKHMTCHSPDLQHFLDLFGLKGDLIIRFTLHVPSQVPVNQPAKLAVVSCCEETLGEVLKMYSFDIAGVAKDWKGLEIIKALFGLPHYVTSFTITAASGFLIEVTATYEPVESNYTGVTDKKFELTEIPS